MTSARILPTYELGATATEGAALFQAPIIRLQIVRESTTTAPRQIRSPGDVALALAGRFADCDREVLVAILLDRKNRILAIDPVSVGCLDGATVVMRECFKSAMLIGAAAVIFAHNHPSGEIEASPEDIMQSRKFVEAGQLLGIDVLDSIILGANGRYASLRERGQL